MAEPKKFINPYAFYNINTQVKRSQSQKGSLSGFINCSLEVKGPVFIPNTTNEFVENEHKSYAFYSYENLESAKKPENPKKPVIPGSEIRGMVRNIYEVLTNSCFSVIDDTNDLYRRTTMPKKPAIMRYENEHWKIYKAIEKIDYKKLKRSSNSKLKHGQDVQLKSETGILRHCITHIPIPFGDNDFIIAFTKTPSQKGKIVDDDVIGRLEKVYKSYMNKKINQNVDSIEMFENMYECFKQRESIFVYVDDYDKSKYISPSCITKEFFVNKLEDILKSQGLHNKCSDSQRVCPACDLFGMVSKKGALGTRVRFTDALPTDINKIKFDKSITLPILGTPRISSTEFYLQKPIGVSDITWNYDYYSKYSYDSKKKKTIENRQFKSPQLSGRKTYWHGKFDTQSADKSNMNCTVSPLKEGEFSFKVYYNDLTEEQLSDLIYSIGLSEEGLHKIGKGKPIGMGDIKVTINNIYEDCYEMDDGTISKKAKEVNPNDYVSKKQNKDMIDLVTKDLSKEDKELVMYPYIEKNGKKQTFLWFAKNKGSVDPPVLKQNLKSIEKSTTIDKMKLDL